MTVVYVVKCSCGFSTEAEKVGEAQLKRSGHLNGGKKEEENSHSAGIKPTRRTR